MKPETAGNAFVGVGGTTIALLTTDGVAIFAGLATSAWMLWQLGCSVYDRWRKK